jgi:hypothetical protein
LAFSEAEPEMPDDDLNLSLSSEADDGDGEGTPRSLGGLMQPRDLDVSAAEEQSSGTGAASSTRSLFSASEADLPTPQQPPRSRPPLRSPATPMSAGLLDLAGDESFTINSPFSSRDVAAGQQYEPRQ